MKLNRANGILSKLRYNSNPDILKMMRCTTLWFTSAIFMSDLGSQEPIITEPNPNISKQGSQKDNL